MTVYKAVNRINSKAYIGITTRSLSARIADHRYRASAGSIYLFHKAIKKYGIDAFEFTEVETTKRKNDLIEKEVYWIKELNTKVPNGYNLTSGGEGVVGWTRTDEWKKRISATMRGRKRPEQSRKMTGENNPNFGKVYSEEERLFFSKNNPTKRPDVRLKLKRPKTEEHKRKLSEANKGKHPTEETLKKLSESHKGKNCGPKSEITKEKMRKNHADFRGEKNPMYGKRFFGKDNPNFGKRRKRAVND